MQPRRGDTIQTTKVKNTNKPRRGLINLKETNSKIFNPEGVTLYKKPR